ncbi:hypothetical protein [Virgibacillus sp. DJP39]|uniref:hypothetical protein n=1 Tax=Virgibacillus sp. DJP39 TaxID=3409790 RepID=UPI003BB80FA1
MAKKKEELKHANFKLYGEDVIEITGNESDKYIVKKRIEELTKDYKLSKAFKRYIIEGILRDISGEDTELQQPSQNNSGVSYLDNKEVAKEFVEELKRQGLVVIGDSQSNKDTEGNDSGIERVREKREKAKSELGGLI